MRKLVIVAAMLASSVALASVATIMFPQTQTFNQTVYEACLKAGVAPHVCHNFADREVLIQQYESCKADGISKGGMGWNDPAICRRLFWPFLALHGLDANASRS